MSPFTKSLHLSVVLVCLTNIATGTSLTVKLEIGSHTPPSLGCVGGDVGLTNTSVLVHYRLYEGTEEWIFLAEVNISESSVTLMHDLELSSDNDADGLQLRLLQSEHGGGGCNCWDVTELAICAHDSVATRNTVPTDISSGCHQHGQTYTREGQARFCRGYASQARGVVTQVFFFRNISGPGSVCPGNSDSLISPKGPALPENCSTATPRM